jgi:hypothetical protein
MNESKLWLIFAGLVTVAIVTIAITIAQTEKYGYERDKAAIYQGLCQQAAQGNGWLVWTACPTK